MPFSFRRTSPVAEGTPCAQLEHKRNEHTDTIPGSIANIMLYPSTWDVVVHPHLICTLLLAVLGGQKGFPILHALLMRRISRV